jgi:hypothetical protein
MNPHAMTRFVITPGVPDLPRDAWFADSTERSRLPCEQTT